MGGGNFFERTKNFFREDTSEVVGAYFDGEKIFVARLTEKFETVEAEFDGAEIEQLAEKISLVCRQRGWKTSAVGFCLREGDAVTYLTEVNFPEKDLPNMVKTWARSQAGEGAALSFVKVGGELWLETMPRATLDEYCAAFEKFGLKLRGLSVMPADLLTKIEPFNRVEFISRVVRERKAPNLLAARGSVWNLKKISLTAAAIFLIAIILPTTKILFDWREASAQLDAEKKSVEELREDLALKEILDADIAELNRLNKICAAQGVNSTRFNFLLNLGKISVDGAGLTNIRAEENFLEIEGLAENPDAVKNYLSRVKSLVAQNARLESSSERDGGGIVFLIRATKQNS